jgi:DNA invertase Pin-like site-specific DNA recombinase
MLICYGRTSTTDQTNSLEAQVERFKELGAEPDHIFAEHGSGKSAHDRGKLQDALRFARKGDVFVVTKLDRLGRSLKDVLEIVDRLKGKGVGFRVLDQSLDTTKPHGKLMLAMLGACAEYEREMIRDRQAEGIRRYQERLAREGRKPGPEPHGKEREIKAMRKKRKMIREIMAETGLSKASVYRALDR